MRPPPRSPLQKLKGSVVLIRWRPWKNPAGQTGRYVIFWNSEEATVSWMNETDVQIMLAKAPLKLPEPDAAAVRAAELALKGHQAVEEQWRRDIDRDVWRWRWIEVKEKVKGLFVSSGGTNSPSGPSA